jgi:hypothetical protein
MITTTFQPLITFYHPLDHYYFKQVDEDGFVASTHGRRLPFEAFDS